jgi:AcrR family transcriptional regulator
MLRANVGAVKAEPLRSRHMKPTNIPGADDASNEHRARLLQAMAHVAAAQGLAATSIAAVVAEAGVSKRTFYEHFADKDACFLELYRAASASALRTLRASVQVGRPWQDQVEDALGAYLAHLSAGPQLIRMLFVEIHQLGPTGASVRREVMQHLADYMLETINASGVALTPTMAMAAVGGIHELVLQAIERGEAAQLERLTPSASAVVRLLAGAPAEAVKKKNGPPKRAV